MDTYDFSAKEPSLGYFYQIKYALFTLLESNLHNPKIRIECLDDLEIIDESSSKLIQTKFHKKESSLTDRNKDFWKTIRIWSEYIKDQIIDISETEVVLVTTSIVSEGSVMSKIISKSDIDTIITSLDAISDEKNKTNQKGYDSYKALNIDQKKALLSKMTIIDSSFDFDKLELKIQEKIKLSTLPSKIKQLSERLYGWWFEESIKLLLEKKVCISLNELQEKIWFINDQMKSDNLPVDYDEKFEIDDKTFSEGNKFTYIKQLDLISTSDNIKKTSMSDYMRAYSQRSKWLREKLLNPSEEMKYDRRLQDHWDRHFTLLQDDSETMNKDEKENLGKHFFTEYFYKNPPSIYIRDRCQDNFVILGSYQMLSDEKKVGWHPDYQKLLEEE